MTRYLLFLLILGCTPFIKGETYNIYENLHFNAVEGEYRKECIVTKTGMISDHGFNCEWYPINQGETNGN